MCSGVREFRARAAHSHGFGSQFTMSTSVRARAQLWAALGLAVSLALPRFAGACSVCLPGDPSFSATGASAQALGSFSLYTEFRSWQKVSGSLPHGHEEHVEAGAPAEGGSGEGVAPPPADPLEFEKNQGNRLDFYLGWTPIDRVTLTLDLPVVWNEVQEIEDGRVERLRMDGFGDLALFASVVLWRDRDVLPETWVEGRGMLKFPTGRARDFDEAAGDPHVQNGTGSWDFGFGLAAAHRFDFATLYGSAFYRENTPGALDYLYGDVALATLGSEIPLGHVTGMPLLDVLVPGLALDFRYAERDHFEGVTYVDSGGSILYATPSLRLRLPFISASHPPSLRAAVQIPLTSSWLYGFQDEDPVWSAGLLVAF
jgi:hypothetical protein